MTRDYFLRVEVPYLLRDLDSHAKPIWGSMSAYQMLDHLRIAFDISIMGLKTDILTPEDKIPAFQAFLQTDRLFVKGAAMPEMFSQVSPIVDAEWEELKLRFIESLTKALHFLDDNEDYKAAHPNFGLLNANQWKDMHQKHIKHHFTQFELIDVIPKN